MAHGFNSFMGNKDFHPGSFRNLKKVYIYILYLEVFLFHYCIDRFGKLGNNYALKKRSKKN